MEGSKTTPSTSPFFDVYGTLRIARMGVVAILVLAVLYITAESLSAEPNPVAIGLTVLLLLLALVFYVLQERGHVQTAIWVVIWSSYGVVMTSILLQDGTKTESLASLPMIVMASVWLTGRRRLAVGLTVASLIGIVLATLNEIYGWIPGAGPSSPLGRLAPLFTTIIVSCYLGIASYGLYSKRFDDLQERERDYRRILSELPDTFIRGGADGKIVMVSPSAKELIGLPPEELIGRSIAEFFPDEQRHRDLEELFARDGRVSGFQDRLRAADGTIKWTSSTASVWRGVDGERLGTEALVRDVSEQREAEESLRRSQRMEAVGQLSGGIAHDFNNILGIIVGHAGLLRRRLAPGEAPSPSLEAIEKSAQRAADLTDRLLRFARAGTQSAVSLNVNEVVVSLSSMLRSSLTQEIALETDLAEDLWPVAADRGELEDVLVNLALNARDAMPDGGSLSIATANRTLSEADVAAIAGRDAGEYAEIIVTDVGVGMSPDVRERAIDPFFTTKPVGEGTGLGLSMVYGFVRRSGGDMTIDSREGKGTTVRLLLPRSAAYPAGAAAATADDATVPGGDERILIVDDEPELVDLTARVLSDLGYDITTVESGTAACDLLGRDREFDLVLSDVVMPGGVSGYDVIRRARELKPNIKVMLFSGFPDRASRGADAAQKVLAKPFTNEELARAVRETLDDTRS